jgi:ketosteroid isomerase-like protein
MRRLVLTLLVLAGCARSTKTSTVTPQGGPTYAAQEGDSVVVLMHKVRPDHRAEYERFMTEVWFPRALRFGNVDLDFGAALARRWRLVSVAPSERDSLYTYMFLYPAFEGVRAADMWRRIGVSEDQIAQDSATQQGLVEVFDGFAGVRREYASAARARTEPAGARRDGGEREETTIRDLEQTWRAALTAKDTAAIRGFYAAGARYLPQWSDGYVGPEAVRDRWAGEILGGEFTLERDPATIEVARAGDMAYEVGTYRVAWSKPQQGESGGGTGNYVTVWKKVDGEWKTAAYIWNQGSRE